MYQSVSRETRSWNPSCLVRACILHLRIIRQRSAESQISSNWRWAKQLTHFTIDWTVSVLTLSRNSVDLIWRRKSDGRVNEVQVMIYSVWEGIAGASEVDDRPVDWILIGTQFFALERKIYKHLRNRLSNSLQHRPRPPSDIPIETIEVAYYTIFLWLRFNMLRYFIGSALGNAC